VHGERFRKQSFPTAFAADLFAEPPTSQSNTLWVNGELREQQFQPAGHAEPHNNNDTNWTAGTCAHKSKRGETEEMMKVSNVKQRLAYSNGSVFALLGLQLLLVAALLRRQHDETELAVHLQTHKEDKSKPPAAKL
jgi:hypothetical protein